MATDATRRVLAAWLAIALAACASKLPPPPPPPPTQVDGTIQASQQVNLSVSKRPSPLLLRVYELKSAAAFNGADFMTLYQRDQAELAADVLGKEEFVMEPGESKRFSKVLAPETRFIGVFAAFRDLEHARWRCVVAVQPRQKQQLVIQAGALSVDATIGR